MEPEENRIIKFKKECLKEEYFSDKFKLKTIDSLLKKEFPLGYKIEHSLVKETHRDYDLHYITIKAKINEKSNIYSSQYGSKPDVVFEEILRRIQLYKEIYQSEIKTNKQLSMDYLIVLIRDKEMYTNPQFPMPMHQEEVKKEVIEIANIYDKPIDVFNEVMDMDYMRLIEQRYSHKQGNTINLS